MLDHEHTSRRPRNVQLLALLVLALSLTIALVASGGAATKPAGKADEGAAPRGKGGHHRHHHSKGKPPSSFFGIDSQDTLSPDDYPRMAANGVKVLRMGLFWSVVQPDDGNSFDFTAFDTYVRNASSNGISVLPYLSSTPSWVAQSLDNRSCGSCSTFAPQSTAALDAWKAFAQAAAGRYGPNGTFWTENPTVPKKPIRKWQVWNEQNSPKFYAPKPDPKKFGKVLTSASQGIRSVDSKAEIILGGMFGLPGRSTGDATPLATYVHKLLKDKSLKKRFDGIALHPYSKLVRSIKDQAEVARKELRKSGYSKAELWITEAGAASGGPPSPLNLGSQKAQAERVTDLYKLFADHRKEWKVPLVAWFAWQDSHASDAFCSFCAKSGLTTESGAAKKSLKAYKKAAK